MQRSSILLLTCLALFSKASAEVAYEFAPNFITPPPGKETIGDGHGEIAVDSAGNVYVSVQEANAGIQVYGTDGKFIATGTQENDIHVWRVAQATDMRMQGYPAKVKSLSGGDIKAGMGGVAGKAQACYAGTQGTASVKLTPRQGGGGRLWARDEH